MLTRIWTSFLLSLAGVASIAWLVALMHEKDIRPVRDLVAFFKKQSKAGRVLLGTFFLVLRPSASLALPVADIPGRELDFVFACVAEHLAHLVENAGTLRLPGLCVGTALFPMYSNLDFLDMLHMPLVYYGAQYLTNGTISKEPTFLIGCTLF